MVVTCVREIWNARGRESLLRLALHGSLPPDGTGAVLQKFIKPTIEDLKERGGWNSKKLSRVG